MSPFPAESTVFRLAVGIGPTLLFEGEALKMFRSLVLGLARPALTTGGPLPEVVESLVIEFVRRAAGGREQDALVWLEGELSAPVEAWTFVEGVGAHLEQRLQLGSCTVANDLRELGLDPALYAPFSMTGPYIAITVEARGQATARLIAGERIAEATALLGLLSVPGAVPDEAHIWKKADGQFGYSTGESGDLRVYRVDQRGKLWPGYHQLSDALARADDQRSDWERRVIGAARWWHKASTTAWPTEVITAGMSALECLVIKPGEWTAKADLVADRASGIAVLAGTTRSAQIGWLRDLYKRRNDALHAGRFHQDDLDALNFLALVDLVAHQAVPHLDPWHRGTNDGPCATIDEVLGPHED